MILRRGQCDWIEGDLRLRLMLWSYTPGGLDGTLFVSPVGPLGIPFEEGGLDATVGVRPTDGDVLTPVAAAFEKFVVSARRFVEGPLDLCWLLMQRTDVQRGDLIAWLYQGYAARLVKALTIARDLGDVRLEQEVLARLRSGDLVDTSPTESEDVLIAARRWARNLSRHTGLPISAD